MKIRKLILPILDVSAFSVGAGVIGDSLNNQGLKDAGSTSAKFIAPMVNISMGGLVINQLRKLKKK